MLPVPPIQGWQSACFSNNLVLSIQLQKNSIQDKRMMILILNEAEVWTPKNTKRD